jgi:hypothetical protein
MNQQDHPLKEPLYSPNSVLSNKNGRVTNHSLATQYVVLIFFKLQLLVSECDFLTQRHAIVYCLASI